MNKKIFENIGFDFFKKNNIIPFIDNKENLTLFLLENKFDTEVVNNLINKLNQKFSVKILEQARFNKIFEKFQTSFLSSGKLDEFSIKDINENFHTHKRETLEISDNTSPVIKKVNQIISDAIIKKASDIHIEPLENKTEIRYRLDGILHTIQTLPKDIHSQIVSRIKIMGKLDLGQSLLPQDGRINLKVAGQIIDIRLSVIPTSNGERVVARILNRDDVILNFDEIGLTEIQKNEIKQILNSHQGMILVCGPTGSGKTTSLYTFLSYLNNRKRNIITLEDPVEYKIEGISQIEINPKIEFTFAKGLRSILRQDPDIILVGEIRDKETADLAIHSALTGHLVLSTLHTSDTISSIARLIDFKIDPFLIASTVKCIISQRLIRKLCAACYEDTYPDSSFYEFINYASIDIDKIKKQGKGCSICKGDGYKGRTAAFEILKITEDIKKVIYDLKIDNYDTEKILSDFNIPSLKQNLIKKVITGQTSFEEILRVL